MDKTRSGHRNPLHLLERILASTDLDALPRDHVTTEWDLAPDDPAGRASSPEPIDDARTALLERVRDLANADPTEEDAPGAGPMSLRRVARLLGGDALLQHPLETLIDAHDVLSKGLPGAALRHLVEHFVVLERSAVLEKGVGIRSDAFRRLEEEPSERLGVEHSGRNWTLAAILATATAAFGTQEEAERWLDRPQIGLDQRRPIDLLATPAGVEDVAMFLQRLYTPRTRDLSLTVEPFSRASKALIDPVHQLSPAEVRLEHEIDPAPCQFSCSARESATRRTPRS